MNRKEIDKNIQFVYSKPGHFNTLKTLDRKDIYGYCQTICVTDSGLTEIINFVVMLAKQSQLRDYVTGNGTKHNSKAEECLCKGQGAAVSSLKVTLIPEHG